MIDRPFQTVNDFLSGKTTDKQNSSADKAAGMAPCLAAATPASGSLGYIAVSGASITGSNVYTIRVFLQTAASTQPPRCMAPCFMLHSHSACRQILLPCCTLQ